MEKYIVEQINAYDLENYLNWATNLGWKFVNISVYLFAEDIDGFTAFCVFKGEDDLDRPTYQKFQRI